MQETRRVPVCHDPAKDTINIRAFITCKFNLKRKQSHRETRPSTCKHTLQHWVARAHACHALTRTHTQGTGRRVARAGMCRSPRSATFLCIQNLAIYGVGERRGDTHLSFPPAPIGEDQHIRFYCISGKLSPGISVKETSLTDEQ